MSPHGIFSSSLIGLGQNPNQDPVPHTKPRHNTGATKLNTNIRKWKQTTLSPVDPAFIGGYGPSSPGETATERSSPSSKANTGPTRWNFFISSEGSSHLLHMHFYL